jgi:hypothetical protein
MDMAGALNRAAVGPSPAARHFIAPRPGTWNRFEEPLFC